MIQIRFIKNCKYGKKGEIKNSSEKGAKSFVSQGYAEYVKKEENKKSKISQEGIGKSSDTSDIGATSDTSDTSDTTPNLYHLKHVSRYFPSVFSDTLTESILRYFFENPDAQISGLQVDELAKNMNLNKGSIRAAINRHKHYFKDSSVKGKAGVIQVDTGGVEEIESRIAQKKAEIDQNLANEKRKEEAQKRQKNFVSDVKKVAQEIQAERDGNVLSFDFMKVAEIYPDLADELLDHPQDFLDSLKSYYSDEYDISIINLPKSQLLPIEDIRDKHYEKFVMLEGRVTSFGGVNSVMVKINYECPGCGAIISLYQDYKEKLISEPINCTCGRRGGFQRLKVDKTDSCFIQLEDLQEKTDNPHSQRIRAVAFNHLTNRDHIKIFTPGNEVRCVGIIKEVPVYKNNKQTTNPDRIFEIYDAELIEKNIDLTNLTKEEVVEIKKVSKEVDENGMDELVKSFAPFVHGYESIKAALILNLCNRRNDRKVKSVRNKSNILLIGDPGVAKTVLCDFAIDVTPGSRKAVGGGSSAVGITASVVKEEESLGGFRVEPGAMILAKELLFIDELNNLQDEDKPKMQQGMSEQKVSINKANIHVEMPVTCGIIAAANPIGGHFTISSDKSIQEQFNIPTPILNRFDTIFVVKDEVHDERDKMIAEKMIRRHRGLLDNKFDKQFLRNFFTYIRQLPEPEITDEIEHRFKEVYSKARISGGRGVKINPRFLESLTRMAVASAKLRQSKHVEEKDIKVAINIISQSYYQINEDLETKPDIEFHKI